MTTTLKAAMQELSKQLGDSWQSTSTSGGSSTTIVDTSLQAKSADWIDYNSYDFITSGTYLDEERKISSLSTATLTTLAHGGTIATAVTYEVHRLFTASEKRTALVWAARDCYPALFKRIRDESNVVGNWLKDGSFSIWTSTTNLTYWTETTVTVTRTNTPGEFKHGAYGAKLSGAAGTLARNITNQDADLLRLAGRSVTFTCQAKCNTDNCLRISINDGVTTTYSDYLDQSTGWTKSNEPLKVTATICDHPASVTFTIHHEKAAGTSYVDDARVISGDFDRIYIGNMGLSQNEPFSVSVETSDYTMSEPWVLLHKWDVDYAGYLYIGDGYTNKSVRVEGIGYLGFVTSGTTTASTAWAAVIDVDQPQLDILIAKAAIYLCQQKIMPADTTGQVTRWQMAKAYWEQEYQRRVQKFGMAMPRATAIWIA
jgi:hypothetical protein